ncbi:MAG TPA: hypothetical protein VF181_09605 [Balneolaceae bacterium]
MKFKAKLLEPDYNRKPYFDGYETDKADNLYDCINCGNTLKIEFDEILHSAYGWKENFNECDAKDISQHFSLNIVGKSHDGGWPSILEKKCEQCNSDYLFYFGLNEYHHSTYKIVLQGISQIEAKKKEA